MAVLPRPPTSPSLNPLDPEAILRDARALPRFKDVNNLATGLSTGAISPEQGRRIVTDITDVQAGKQNAPLENLPVATVATDTGPIAAFDDRAPADRVREQNEFRARFDRPLPSPDEAARRAAVAREDMVAQLNGHRAQPQVQGPAQRAVQAANERGGAGLPRPPTVAPGTLIPVQPDGSGRNLSQTRQLAREEGARQTAMLAEVRRQISPPAASQAALTQDPSLRVVTPEDTPETLQAKAAAIAEGEGGGLFANFGRGLAAGTLGMAGQIGTVVNYLGYEVGIDAVADLGVSIEKYWQKRQENFVRAANLPTGNLIDNKEMWLDGDFMAFQVGSIIPSLAATFTPAGAASAAVRKHMLKELAKTAGRRGVGKAAEKGAKDTIIKVGNRSLDMTDPLVVAKVARIGKAQVSAGMSAGLAVGGALEGSSTYRETLAIMRENGASEEVSRETAENAGLMMFAATGILNAVGIERFLKVAPGVKAKVVRGLVEAVTEWAEGPAEALIQLGQETITVEEAIKKIKDEVSVAPAAFIASFLIPGSGAAIGIVDNRPLPPAEAAAANIEAAEEGELPEIDPGAGPAGGAANVTTEEASGVAQANVEEVDETTVQEPDQEVQGATTVRDTEAKVQQRGTKPDSVSGEGGADVQQPTGRTGRDERPDRKGEARKEKAAAAAPAKTTGKKETAAAKPKAATAEAQAKGAEDQAAVTSIVTGVGGQAPQQTVAAFNNPNITLNDKTLPDIDIDSAQLTTALKDLGLPSSGNKTVKRQRLFDNQVTAANETPEAKTFRKDKELRTRVLTPKTDEEFATTGSRNALVRDAEALGVPVRSKDNKATIAKNVRAAASATPAPIATAPATKGEAKKVKPEETVRDEEVKVAHAKAVVGEQEEVDFTAESGVPAPADDATIAQVARNIATAPVEDDDIVEQIDLLSDEELPGPKRNKGGKRRLNAKGDVSGAPEGIKTERQVAGLIRRMVNAVSKTNAMARFNAAKGTIRKDSSLFWYERSAQEIRRVARGNPERMEQLTRLMALYSQANSVSANTTAAIRSLNEYLDGNVAPLAGRFPKKTAPLIDSILKAEKMTTDVAGVEKKVLSFYRNLHDPLFNEDTFGDDSTIDLWMMRLMGFDKETPTDAQYAFGREVMIRATESFNRKHSNLEDIKPRMLQAAVWTKVKNDEAQAKQERVAGVTAIGQAKSVRALATDNSKGQLIESIRVLNNKLKEENLAKLNKKQLAQQLKKSANNKPKTIFDEFVPKSEDFQTNLKRRSQFSTAETVPSTKLDIGKALQGATFEDKLTLDRLIGENLTGEQGEDLLAAQLGIELGTQQTETGGYVTEEGERTINPLRLSGVLASQETGETAPSRQQVDAYSLASQYLFRQDAVPWFRAAPNLTGADKSVGFSITFTDELTAAQEEDMFSRLTAMVDRDGGFTRTAPGEYAFINFRNTETGKSLHGITDPTFRGLFLDFANSIDGEIGDVDIIEEFRAEGEYHGEGPNDESWDTDPEGRWIEDKISEAGFADILPWLRSRRKVLDGISNQVASEVTSRSKAEAAKREAERSEPRPIRAPVPLARLIDTFGQAIVEITGRFGTFTGKNTQEQLKIYPLEQLTADPQQVLDQAAQHGYLVKFFSFKANPAKNVEVNIPRLNKDGYENGTVWIYDPRNSEGSFKDSAYTLAWRVSHEMAHGITEQFMQTKYGDSKRYGRLGRDYEGLRGKKGKAVKVPLEPLTLMEAQRAIEWEEVAFRVGRMLTAELGITITDEQFNSEIRINVADAMYRSLTGEFGENGENGFVPDEGAVDVKDILIALEETEALLAFDQQRDPTAGIDLNTWQQVPDSELIAAIERAKSNGNPNTAAQAAAAGKSATGAILTEADINAGGIQSTVAEVDRPAAAASGAAAQLSDAKETDELLSADDRILRYTDPKRRDKEADGMDADDARLAVIDIIQTMNSVVRIKVVQSVSDLPARMKNRGTRIKGVFSPSSNEVHIVADNLHNAADAERVIMHEVFGHYSMRTLPNFDAVQSQVQAMIDRGTDEVLMRAVEAVESRGTVKPEVFVEEVIAYMAETSATRNGAMQEIIAQIKAFVQKLGFKTVPGSSEVMGMIRASRRRAQMRALAAGGIGVDRNSQEYNDFLASDNLKDLRKAGNDEQVGAALERLAREFNEPLFSDNAPMNEDLDGRWKKAMNVPKNEQTFSDRIKQSLQMFHDLSFDEVTQGIFDGFNAIKSQELALFGQILDASLSAYKSTSTLRNMNNVMGAVMRHGIPTLKTATQKLKDLNGVERTVTGRNFREQEDAQSFQSVFLPLGAISGESQMRNWEKWAVARRSRRLIDEDIHAGRVGEAGAREKNVEEELVDDTLAWARDRTADDGRTYEEVFEEVLANWDTLNQANIDLAIETGVINKEEAELWRRYDYVPFWREMTQLENRAAPGAGRDRIDVGGSGLFRLRGGVDREGSPLKLEGNVIESMFMNTAYLLERSYRNESMKRITDLGTMTGAMRKAPMVARPVVTVSKKELVNLLWKSGLISEESADAAEAVFDTWPKNEQQRWQTFWSRVKPPGEDVVTLMVDGKPTYYFVDDPLMLRSIAGLRGDQLGSWMTAFRTSKKWLTLGVTTDPAFMIANWMRDTVSSLIVSDAPINSLSAPITAVREAFNDSPAMLHLAFAGRGGGGFYDTNPEQIRGLLKDVGVAEADMNSFMNTIVSPRKMWKLWRRVGTASEFGNRVRIYNAKVELWHKRTAELEQQGLSPQAAAAQTIEEGIASPSEAAFQAQDLLNFTRSGDWVATQMMIQMVPFLNARLQGLNKFYRGAKEHPLGFSMKAGSLVALSIAYTLMNDDDERYRALSQWDKDTYYHFFIGDSHFRLPKPFEAGVMFSTIPERLTLALKGQEGWDIFFERMGASAFHTFAFNPYPQLVRPIIEDTTNRNMFRGTPIVPLGLENLKPDAQYDFRTGSFARAVGRTLPDIAPDFLQSPKRLEALIQGYFGALGVYVLGVGNVLTDSILHGPTRALGEIAALPLHDIPVVKRFAQSKVPTSTKYNQLLWEMMKEADGLARTLKVYQETGQFEAAMDLRRDEAGILAARKRLRSIQRQVTAVNRQLNQVALNQRLKPEIRQKQLESLRKRKNALAKQVEPLIDLF
jgi:hypothetical protein